MATDILMKMDSKQRIVISRRLRKASGIEAGEILIAIPFRGGIVIASAKGRKFAGSLTGFGFDEMKHQATRYLTELGNADNRHGRPVRGS